MRTPDVAPLGRRPGGGLKPALLTPRAGIALLGVATALLVFFAYARVLRGEFLWDDDAHIYANPTIVGPLGLKEIWTSGKANYFPLTMTSFWVQHALWGLAPAPYHAVTILFHVAGALVLWRVLARLAVPGAWLGAMLWALHPVQVESVAWICELKNTQSGFFYLLAIYFFLRWLPREGAPPVITRDYVFAFVSAVLAILSKSSTVMLPVVLGLLGAWSGRRGWRDLRWLLPFLAVSAVASGWTIWEQKVNSMASGPDWSHGLAARLTIAGKVPWFYLGKLLWPHPLVFIYPRWEVSDLTLADWLPLVATFAVIAGAWRVRAGRGRPLFLVAGIFGVSLFPVLGLFDVFFFKYSFVGDHFQYLASMAPLALIGAAVTRLARHAPTRPVWLERGAVAALLGLAGVLTMQQTGIYLSREALWRDTVERNPRAWIARMNLGSEYMQQGQPARAIPHFEAALKLRPGDALAEANWGASLLQLDRPAEAVPHLENSTRLMPALAEAYNSLGLAYAALGRREDAIAQFEAVARLKPELDGVVINIANLLVQAGRSDEAFARVTRAVHDHPGSVKVRRALGTLCRGSGRSDEAIGHYRAALQLDPNDLESLCALVDLLAQKGQHAQALEFGARALQLQPDSADCQLQVGRALLFAGRPGDAIPHLEYAVRARPDAVEAREGLGAALYQTGRAADAVPHYLAVVQARPASASARSNLASALLQTSRLPEAIAQYREAVQLDPAFLQARLNFALALEAAGQKAEAIAQYEEVLRQTPAHAEARQKLQRLRSPNLAR